MAGRSSVLILQGSMCVNSCTVLADPSIISQALLDKQENSRAVLAAARDCGGGGTTRPPAGKDRGGGGGENVVATPVARAARSEKPCPGAVVAPRTPAREAEPARQKVYSACSSVGGGGRRAFAEFSSYVVRKAPPLERKLECTLEELCRGCKKEVKFTRDVVTKNGYLLLSYAFPLPFDAATPNP